MARQFSGALRDARANAYESTIGTAAVVRGFTGSPPANCAAASTGTQLFSMTLPSDWMGASSGGVIAKAGTWQVAAAAAGVLGYYRVFNNGATTCHDQGTITATGDDGDMTVDNTNVAVNQVVTITSFGWTEPNA